MVELVAIPSNKVVPGMAIEALKSPAQHELPLVGHHGFGVPCDAFTYRHYALGDALFGGEEEEQDRTEHRAAHDGGIFDVPEADAFAERDGAHLEQWLGWNREWGHTELNNPLIPSGNHPGCLRSEQEVDAFFAHLMKHKATITKMPEKVFWGGYSGYFADSDGRLWEVAFNPFPEMDAEGNVLGMRTS